MVGGCIRDHGGLGGGVFRYQFAAGVDKDRGFRCGYFLYPFAFAIVVVFADRCSIRVFYFRLLVVAVKNGCRA